MSRKKDTPAHRPGPITGTVSRSLHTPTALAALALHLHCNGSRRAPAALVIEAAHILRIPGADTFGPSDPTHAAALKTLARFMEQEEAK